MSTDTLDEVRKAGRAADRIDRERSEALGSLVKHAGWKIYVELLQSQIQSRGEEILAPGKSVDGLIALEYVKGAMSGLLLAVGLPDAIIAQMKSQPADEGDDE